jgi:hypothetical protein
MSVRHAHESDWGGMPLRTFDVEFRKILSLMVSLRWERPGASVEVPYL